MIVPEAKTLETSASNLLILVSVLERILSSSASEFKEKMTASQRDDTGTRYRYVITGNKYLSYGTRGKKHVRKV